MNCRPGFACKALTGNSQLLMVFTLLALDQKFRISDHPRMPKRSFVTFSVFLLLAACQPVQAQTKRAIAIDDIYRTQQVAGPQCSPDGKWIAYTVTSMDREADKRRSSVWMVNWEGTHSVQLTSGADGDTAPRWSPDGNYLAFLSARPAGAKKQVWLLDRLGGEARQLTQVTDEISSYAWSPDSSRLVLEMSASDDDAGPAKAPGASPKAPKPIVINRTHFKQDIDGYLTAASRSHLYLFEVKSKKLEPLTTDKNFEDSGAVWSPDSKRIAFVSNHEKDPDQSGVEDIFVIEARPGSAPVKLASALAAGRQHLAWSADGKFIAFLLGAEAKYDAYKQDRLAVVPAGGGSSRILNEKFDRGVSSPEFTSDSSGVTVLVADDGREYPAKFSVTAGSVERLSASPFVVSQLCTAGGRTAVLASSDTVAPEVFALENGELRKLTSHNDALLSELQLGAVQDISFKSKDGTEVHGLMTKPPGYEAAKKYPTLLWIHGGPNGQDDHSLPFNTYPLQLERQLFAAHGYVVLAINYRGSSGRGAEFSRSIFADWGNKEVADLLAGVDFAVASGVADPARLGIGGWSYGGMLTDYTIASDTRFKAAISGAGLANAFAVYGSDQYILQYTNELGAPWKSPDAWTKVSYPFLHADRIKTPTLFMGGQSDFNVPIIGSEQMYQALRTLGIPTELVIYPEQFHLFTRPSYIHDRMQRYLGWFDAYLHPEK
jgi:dipeptidyl aminopeptidase/acylaminoacyl peptidase